MAKNKEGLEKALTLIQLRDEFWNDVCIPGDTKIVNQELEKANRLADFFDLGELMCRDALTREESCGGHFRESTRRLKVKLRGMMRISVMLLYGSIWESVKNL